MKPIIGEMSLSRAFASVAIGGKGGKKEEEEKEDKRGHSFFGLETKQKLVVL